MAIRIAFTVAVIVVLDLLIAMMGRMAGLSLEDSCGLCGSPVHPCILLLTIIWAHVILAIAMWEATGE